MFDVSDFERLLSREYFLFYRMLSLYHLSHRIFTTSLLYCRLLSIYLMQNSHYLTYLTDYLLSLILQMTDWESLIPTVSRLVCEDEVSGLAVNKKYIICQFWIQPEIAVFSRYSLELVRYGNVINWQ